MSDSITLVQARDSLGLSKAQFAGMAASLVAGEIAITAPPLKREDLSRIIKSGILRTAILVISVAQALESEAIAEDSMSDPTLQ